MRIVNKIAREFVKRKLPFTGNNIHAEKLKHGYIVYSYGIHYPMYIYSNFSRHWFGNSDHYSLTTEKHKTQCKTQCKPQGNKVLHLDTEQMNELIITLI